MDDDVIYTGGGRPQGAPLPMFCPEKGTHKGGAYMPVRAATRRRR